MKIPKDLGGIEFLRNHPAILAHLIRNSSKESLDPYIKNRGASTNDGGFYWAESKEGHDFWEKILIYDMTSIYYEKYPEKSKDISSEFIPEITHSKITLLTTKSKYLNVNQND